MKDFINKGLDDVYNRIGMGASNMGNTLLDEIKANREMINNFRTQKTFIPTGNNSPPASIDLNNNNFIPLSDQAHYQNYLDEKVDTDSLPAYKPIKKETFTNDKSIRGKPISMANVIEELQLKFNKLKEREKDTEVFPNLKVEDAEDDEEEPQLKDEGDDEELPAIPEPINQPVLDFYNILFDNQGKAKNKIQGFNQAQLLNEFYKTYPDKNIKVKNGEIKIRNKKETDILNFNFPGVGKGIYSKLLKKIQNYVKDDL